MKIGVLALQGDVREHIQSLSDCGVSALAVKTKSEIEDISALVIPGGESTTIAKLARSFDLFDQIKDRIKGGMPTYGSCAGMILLSDVIEDAIIGQESFGGIDMVVKRNAFGRQVDSFEIDLHIPAIGEPDYHAVFIRAPLVEAASSAVEVLAAIPADKSLTGTDQVVAVRQGNLMATSFHPEITSDLRIHKYFVDMVRSA